MRTPKRMKLVTLLFLSATVVTPAAQAFVGLCCGKCGGNMPMNIMGGGVPETKEYRLKISPMQMSMEGLLDGTNAVDPDSLLGMPVMMGSPTGQYMAVPTEMDMTMLNVTAGYSFSDDLFGAIMLMGVDKRMDMKFNAMMATNTGQPGFTMESSGIGDTMLMGKYRLFANDPLIPTRQASFMFGLSLPTGSIDERNSSHPLAMRQAELQPYGMQLGSGTYDPSVGLLYQASASPYWWGVNGTLTARLHDNERDYRRGNEVKLDVYGMYQFRHDLLVQTQLNGSYTGRIRGEADEALSTMAATSSGRVTQGNPSSPYMTPLWDPNNYGGRKVLATVGLQWQPMPLHIVDLNVGVPVYQNLNGPQMEEKMRVMLTWYIEIPTEGSIRHKNHKAVKDSNLGF